MTSSLSDRPGDRWARFAASGTQAYPTGRWTGLSLVVDPASEVAALRLSRAKAERRLGFETLDTVTRGIIFPFHQAWEFFSLLFLETARFHTAADIARELRTAPSTLVSRFLRADLPSPRRYLGFARLIQAAYLLEDRSVSLRRASVYLGFSSPQSFGRHVRLLTGIPAAEWRMRYSGAKMRELFRQRMMLPYAHGLRAFDPLGRAPAARVGLIPEGPA